MHVDQAIRTRRTVRQFQPRPVERPLIEELIELATWAPNHRLAEPWRFYVLIGAGREPLAALHRELVRQEAPGDLARAEQRYAELMNVPVFLVVTYIRDENPRHDRENYAAACCAIQNLMLAAHARGLGAHWRTGNIIRDQRTRSLLSVGPDEEIAGLLHLGYPAETAAQTPAGHRTPAAQKTIFMEG